MIFSKDIEERLTDNKDVPVDRDIRIKAAEQIYVEIDNHISSGNRGIFLINKETRAGATSSLIAESINRAEPLLVIEPTNEIILTTVIEDGIKYSNKPDAKILQILPNKFCSKIQSMILESPLLEKLPVILRPEYCFDCDCYDSCKLTEIFRETHDGWAINYQKLAYTVASVGDEDSVSTKLLGKLLTAQNILFDEIHYVQSIGSKSISIIGLNTSNNNKQAFDLEKYDQIDAKYSSLKTIIQRAKKIFNNKDVKTNVENVLNDACSQGYFSKHINIPMVSPLIEEYDVNNDNSIKLLRGFFQDVVELVQNNDYHIFRTNDKIDDEGIIKQYIIPLYDMASIATSQIISIGAVRSNSNISVNISSPDTLVILMINEFLKQATKLKRRIIFTSATICNLDQSEKTQYWVPEYINFINLFFGENGSPMNLNSKLRILTYGRRYGSIGERSVENNIDEIIYHCTLILHLYGAGICKIVARSGKIAHMIQDELKKRGIKVALKKNKTQDKDVVEVTYYKADDTIGVSSDRRVLIAVGFSNKPSNSCDSFTTNYEKSREMLAEMNQVDFYQTISRVKDVTGIEPSLVFALGITYNEVECATTWGSDRKVTILPTVNGQANKLNVSVTKRIPGPKIIDCKSFDMMLLEGLLHKSPTFWFPNLPGFSSSKITRLQCTLKNFISISASKAPIEYNNNYHGAFDAKIERQILNSSFLTMIMTNKKPGKLTPGKINDHAKDKNILKTCTITTNGMAKWLRFGGLDDESKTKLVSFLALMKIPNQLEKIEEKYNVWIFLKPVKARKAKTFGKHILKLLNIDCELLPNNVNGNTRQQEIIKLPLSSKSLLLINDNNILESDMSNFDVDEFGECVMEMLGSFDRNAYRRQVYSLNRWYEEYEALEATYENDDENEGEGCEEKDNL